MDILHCFDEKVNYEKKNAVNCNYCQSTSNRNENVKKLIMQID